MGVAVYMATSRGGDASAFGVDDAIVVVESRSLGFRGAFGGKRNVDIPRMMQVEVG